MFFFKKNWNPDGLHAYVTGGSTGTGLALAILLTQKGAHVSIVARNQGRLDKALIQLEAARQRPDQILKAYSYSLNDASTSEAALRAACVPHNGEAPDAVFACAGASKPMFFVEMEERDLVEGMTNGYWVQAWTAYAAARMMVRQGRKGKIALVSSTLGYMSFLGWASYAPAKHALRGLADTLYSELMLYGIDVHCFFPNTIYSPGYEEENKTKPKIVRDIEGTDEGMTPEASAFALLRGVERGDVHITGGDFITNVFRASTRGAAPRNNWFMDAIYDCIGYIAVPIWKTTVDRSVVAHRSEHAEHLRSNGFFA